MLIATETRKARVHGRLRNPSTNRSEVVNPTSNRPPTISHSHGMTFLSLDDDRTSVTLTSHDETAHHRQQDWPVALSGVRRGAGRRGARGGRLAAQLVARHHGRFRRR